MRFFFLLSLLILASFSFGQDDYKKGYIIRNNGDTSYGYIKQEIEEKLSTSVDFRNQQGSISTLSATDIKGFGIEGKNHFRIVNYIDPLDSFERKIHFAKLLLDGNYQIFSFRRKEDLYFIVSGNDTSYLLYDDLKTNLGQLVENGNYQNQLFFLARECSGVQKAAGDTRFTEEGFVSFFRSFEKCRGNTTHTGVYYSRQKTRAHVFLSVGAMSADEKTEICGQALLQFVIPAISEKTSLNTGFVYLRRSRESVQPYSFGEIRDKYLTEIFEVPFVFRYDIARRIVQPYVFAGPGVLIKNEKDITKKTELSTETITTSRDSSLWPTLIFAAGIDFRIVKNFFLDLNWRYDLTVRLPVAGFSIRIK